MISALAAEREKQLSGRPHRDICQNIWLTRTLAIMLCRPSRNSWCLADMHVLETMTLSILGAFYFEVAASHRNDMLSNPPPSTCYPTTSFLPHPIKFAPSEPCSSNRPHASFRFVAVVPMRSVCLPLSPTSGLSSCWQHCLQPGAEKKVGWQRRFFWQTGCVMPSTRKGSWQLPDRSEIFWGAACCHPTCQINQNVNPSTVTLREGPYSHLYSSSPVTIVVYH